MLAPRALLKRVLPPPLRRAARFFYRLPVHYRIERSYQICSDRAYGHDMIALNGDIAIAMPDHAVACSVFRNIAFETRGRSEVEMFLALAEPRNSAVI